MAGLIEEIQRDALDPSVPVSTILRKVKIAAAKLSLPALEGWVQMELEGHTGELPGYRQLVGRPKALNPFQGWIPIMMASDRDQELISQAPVRQSISSLEDLVERSKGGHIEVQFPASFIRMMNEQMGVEFGQMANHLAVTQVQAIINTVRDMALDWAVRMEQQGIVGIGLSFNANEKAQAQTAMATFTVGNIGQFIGTLGSANSSGDINGTQSTNSSELFDRLLDLANEEITNGIDRGKAIAAIEGMRESQGDKPSYAKAYSDFIASIANHMTVFSPYIAPLAALLG